MLGRCTTSKDGACSINMRRADSYSSLTGAVLVDGQLQSMKAIGPWSKSDDNLESPYRGSLILDRSLVTRGDSIHVTGYVVSKNSRYFKSQGVKSGVSVQRPDVTTATIQISPGLDGSNEPTRYVHQTARCVVFTNLYVSLRS